MLSAFIYSHRVKVLTFQRMNLSDVQAKALPSREHTYIILTPLNPTFI